MIDHIRLAWRLKDRHCTYDVNLRRACSTIVAAESNEYYIL